MPFYSSSFQTFSAVICSDNVLLKFKKKRWHQKNDEECLNEGNWLEKAQWIELKCSETYQKIMQKFVKWKKCQGQDSKKGLKKA
jgi:hypothetical protein